MIGFSEPPTRKQANLGCKAFHVQRWSRINSITKIIAIGCSTDPETVVKLILTRTAKRENASTIVTDDTFATDQKLAPQTPKILYEREVHKISTPGTLSSIEINKN